MRRQDHSHQRGGSGFGPSGGERSGQNARAQQGEGEWEDPLDFSGARRHRSYADRLTEAWGGPNEGSGPDQDEGDGLPPERDYARGHWGGGSYSQPGFGRGMNPGGRPGGMAARGMPGHGGGPAGQGMSRHEEGQQQGFGHGFLGGRGFDQPSGGPDFLHQQGFGASGYGGQPGRAGMQAEPRKGPKGYTRSDERIRDDVCERLYHLHEVDVSEVSVEVQQGTVVLSGSVGERWQKHRIEDVVDQCLGVREVENRIRVQRPGATAEPEAGPAGSPEGSPGESAGSGRSRRPRH